MEFSFPTIRGLEVLGAFTKTKRKESISDCAKTPFRAPTLLSPHSARQCTELNLQACELTDLPDTIGLFFMLKKLNLSENKLSVLPVQVGKLFSLVSFDVSKNQIKVLPDEVGCLRHLVELKLHHNQLRALPDAVEQFVSLQDLNVFNNKILKLGPAIGTFKEATTLNFASNHMMQIPWHAVNAWAMVKILNIFDCRIIHLPSLEHLHNLIELRAFGNNLQKVPDFGAGGSRHSAARNLKLLELHRNSIREVPAGFFPSIPNVKRLSLGVNLLEALPSDLQGQSLEMFFCDNNRIKTLPETIGYLPMIKVLFVEYNVLTGLPWSLMRNTTIRRINLARNPKVSSNPEFKPILDHLKKQCKQTVNGQKGRYIPPNSL